MRPKVCPTPHPEIKVPGFDVQVGFRDDGATGGPHVHRLRTGLTADQKLDIQNDALTKAGCERIFTDTAAWKKGEARGLARRTPPIGFVDEDFVAGLRLSDYEIDQPDAPTGPHQDVHVILSLRDARGKAIQRESRYQVLIEPTLAVLRSDH